jgi:iron complex outermembrane receptor protein
MIDDLSLGDKPNNWEGMMMMKKYMGVSALAMALVSQQAWAQTSPDAAAPAASDNDQAGLTDIIVTAQKRSERLQDVPIAIVSISADQIAARGIAEVRDLNTLVPSLNVTASTGHALPSLRGVGSAVLGPGIESPVAFYVDGVYYADSAQALLSFNSISQIDVLKGPQGTLFGRNSTGGVIQVTTLDPSHTAGMRGLLSYGNYETVSAKAYVTGGLTDTIAANLAIQYSHQGDGYGKNLATGEDTNLTDHDFAVRSKILFEPAEGTKITLIGDYSDLRSSLGAALGTAPGRPNIFPTLTSNNPRDIDSNLVPYVRVEAGGGSARLEQEIGTVRLVSITAYRKSYYDLLLDVDGTSFNAAQARVTARDHQFSQEVQLLSDSENKSFQWVIGGYYYNSLGKFDPSEVTLAGPLVNPVFPLAQIVTFGSQRTRSIAGFAEAKIELTPTTHLTLGGRVTHEKRSLDAIQLGYLVDGTPIGNLIPPISGASMSVTKPTWRIVLDQKLGDDALVYVSYNRGFKSGGFNASIPTDPSYKPEKLDAYEAGFKSSLFDRRVRLNAAAYYYSYGNFQAASFVLGNVRVNNSSARIYGAEGDIEIAVTDQFRITGGAAYVNAQFRSFPNGTLSTPLPTGGTLQTIADLSNNRLSYVPKFTASIGGSYTVEAFGGKLNFDANLYHNSGFFSEADNLLRQKAYELLTASVAWTDPSDALTIRLWGKNLTDEDVATQLSSSSLNTAVVYQAPRTYGVEVGFKF